MKYSLVTTGSCPGVERVTVVWAGSLLTIPTGTVGGRQPGEERRRLGPSAIVPSPGAEEEDWSDSIAVKILFLILVKHDSMKSRSSRISPGSGRKPALDW